MFYNSEQFAMTSKSLAMLANDQVAKIADAMATDIGADYTADVTGAALALTPHIVEKAILTSPSVPGDVSVRLTTMFVDEFEAVAKIVCNVGGFSNPVKRALFNASFHTLFRRQYRELKPKVDEFWHMAREKQVDPIVVLALVAIKYCENATRVKPKSANCQTKTEEVHRPDRHQGRAGRHQRHRACRADRGRQMQQAPPERGLYRRGIGYCLRREKPSPARPRPRKASVAIR